MCDESPIARLRDMKHRGLAPSSLAVATASAAAGSPSTTMMLQGPTPVASNTTRSNIYNNDNNSGCLFHQQQHHRHVQAKTVSTSSLQAALADIQRKEQRANEKEAESRECDDQHAHTWLVPEERVDDGNNAENRQDSVDAENNDDDDDNDEVREGGSTSSTSMAIDDIVVSTTMESREGSHSEQEGSSVASRGRLHSKHASVGSGLLGMAIPSHDDKDTFVTVDDDTTTKSTEETYKDDDDDDTTKVGNEDLTLSNPASLDGTLSGGTLGRCGGDDATKNDADAALSFMRSKSQTLDGANDGKDDDESTTIDIIETSILAKGINYTDPSTVANRIRLATDGSSAIVATDNEEEEETVASSAEN